MRTNTLGAGMNALLFKNTTFAGIGDATGLVGSATAGSFYIGLHLADPGETGDQTTSEATHGGYARKAIARTGSAWTTTATQVENAADTLFNECSSGTETITHWSLGSELSGTGLLLYRGPLMVSGAGILIGIAATDDNLTIPGHSFSVNNTIMFYPIAQTSLPTGITAGINYYVKTVSGDVITISATQGGSTLNITGAGGFYAFKTTTLAISANIQPKVAAGAIVLKND